MNGFAFLLSAVLLLLVWDRQRAINWRTARASANVALLLHAAVGFWGAWEACTGDVSLLLWVLLVASVLRLLWTMRRWAGGVPREIRTGHGDLGAPELERFK